ncbi:hypothetical protein D3C73_860310 [compost metagenome]
MLGGKNFISFPTSLCEVRDSVAFSRLAFDLRAFMYNRLMSILQIHRQLTVNFTAWVTGQITLINGEDNPCN